MGKLIYGVIIALILGIILYPSANYKVPEPQQFANDLPQQQIDVQGELKAKQALVDEDVRITEELSRQDAIDAVRRQIAELRKNNSLSKEAFLKQLSDWLAKNLNVIYVQYGSLTKEDSAGPSYKTPDAPPQVIAHASEYLEEASRYVHNKKPYASKRFQAGDNVSYFVFGEPSADFKYYMVGIVKQDVLERVKTHQRKNMRLEPFQSEQKGHVKTVQPGQLKAKSNEKPNNVNEESHYVKNEVVVKFRKAPTTTDLGQILSQINGKVINKHNSTYIFKSNKMDTPQLIQYFEKLDVDFAEPHYLYMTNGSNAMAPGIFDRLVQDKNQPFMPNDELYPRYQWNLRQVGTEQGWSINRDASGVLVGVIDTGIDLTHPDIQAHLVKGYNVVKPDASPEDDVGHGTHVAGVISALVNNRLGVAGMTWSSRILPVKVLDETGAGSTYAVALGIIWATDQGAKVINMSLGNYATSGFLHDAIKYAYDRDVVLIAASGNDNTDRPSYPAYYPEVFAVAASDSNNNRAPFSNFGPYIDVAAPGVNIASTYPKNQYVSLSGTSMASPHVAALAALIRATNPALKNTEVMDIMRSTAQDIGDPGVDPQFGHGLINVPKAVEEAMRRK